MKIFLAFLKGIFGAFLLFSFFISSASEQCTIKNGMSTELSTYLKTTEKLLSNIRAEASKTSCGLNGGESSSASIEKTSSAFVGSMNEAIGFSNFATSGRFYIDLALKSEIPAGITRDHEQLGKEIDRIKNTMEIVYNICAGDLIPMSNLSEDPVYNTTGKTLGIILTEVLKNQVNIMNFYRETVLGDVTTGQSFILVGNSQTFVSRIQNQYGPNAWSLCNQESDFFKDIKGAFGRITNLGGNIAKGMDEWSKAAKLLGSDSSNQEYAATERNLLRDEMSQQGMSTKGSQATLNCLAQYNNTGVRCGLVGGLTESISGIGENIKAVVKGTEKVYATVRNMLTTAQTTDEYIKIYQTSTEYEIINNEIKADYTNAKNLLGPESLSADEMVARLIDTHILLGSTNKTTREYIKIAEQTCNGQSTGEGNCKFH